MVTILSAVVSIRRLAVMGNPGSASSMIQMREVETTGRTMGVEITKCRDLGYAFKRRRPHGVPARARAWAVRQASRVRRTKQRSIVRPYDGHGVLKADLQADDRRLAGRPVAAHVRHLTLPLGEMR